MKENETKELERTARMLRNVAVCLTLAGLVTMLWLTARGEALKALLVAILSLGGSLVAIFQDRVAKEVRVKKPRRGPFAVDDAGVSPVIAVILMVAITVVLAATVFVLVADIEAGPVPVSLGFQVDTVEDTLTVTSVSENGLTWQSINVIGCLKPGNETGVDAGDELTQCSGNVKVIHVPSNTLIYSARFD